MPVVLSAIFGFFSSAVQGLFAFRGEQAKSVQNALSLIQSVDTNDATTIAAQANAISVILSQGSWLEKQWRPILMLLLISIVGAFWYGYTPPHFNDQLSPMMQEVLTLLKIGVMGYVPCRTIEKIVTQMNIASILKQLIQKQF